MNKKEFLNKLSHLLSSMPKSERQRILDFYREIIEDRMENGESESEIIAEFGDIDLLAQKILAENPARKSSNGWRRALLIILFIFCFPLYVSVWTTLLSFYIGARALIAAALVLLVTLAFTYPINWMAGIIQTGGCMISAGLGILAFLVCVWLTRLFIKFTVFYFRKVSE